MQLASFKRVTSGRFIPEIDGLRFLAILPVFLMHAATSFKKNSAVYHQSDLKGQWLNDLINTGAVGVYLFFVISGFILALPFARWRLEAGRPVELGRYFRKRLTRLEPPYLITLTLLLLVHLVYPTEATPEPLSQHYAAGFFYLHNILFPWESNINPVAWSLEIEIQFYVLVPLITAVFLVRNDQARRLLLLAAILFFCFPPDFLQWRITTLVKFFQYFLTGFLMADLYLRPPRINLPGWLVDVVGLFAIAAIFWAEYEKTRYWLPLAFALVFLAAFRGRFLRSFFANTYIATVGGMCYIIYLVHFPLFFFLTKFTQGLVTGYSYPLDLLIQYALLLPVGLAICAAAFLVLEKPFMYYNWPEMLLTKVKTRLART